MFSVQKVKGQVRDGLYVCVNYLLQEEDISVLNMATGSRSWWARNGYGCHADAVFTHNTTAQPMSPSQETAGGGSFVGTTIVGCILNYEYIEVLHAGVQFILVVSPLFTGFPPRLLESPGFFSWKFQDLESPGI